jgi:E3 ubiquitin-protein ligase synoviolin
VLTIQHARSREDEIWRLCGSTFSALLVFQHSSSQCTQVSTALAGFVVLKALAQRPNFYSAAIYLSNSSANLMILTNLIFVAACAFMLGLQKLLYGPLRPIEVEQLYEKAWFAVTETCLAMTIFRGEIGPWFLVMFFCLLAGKVWGWIGEGRVEILEQQPPRNPRLFHTRLALSLALSVAFDLSMLEYIVSQVMRMAKPDMMVMFGFEFAILSIMSISTGVRYGINLMEIGIVRQQKELRRLELRKHRLETAKRNLEEAQRVAEMPETERAGQSDAMSVPDAMTALQRASDPIDDNEIEVEGWENKGRFVFYLDLSTDFFKLVVYLSFFFILLVFYGLPIHIMRDVFLTTRSFFKRIADFMRYRTATRDMNERYPDATVDDIGREDVCIICREEMRPYQPPGPGQPISNPAIERMRPKKLPCGHVLHFACLRSWLERQQACPTCRRSVVPPAATASGSTGVQPAAGQGHAQAGQHPAGERQGPRVFQFGPLRIGVGAARGNMFEQLQQQMANGRAAPQARGEQNGPQQIGFGIRWDGRQRQHRRRQRENVTVRDQLDTVEQQIRQDMQALGQNMQEYAVLSAMHSELERLRANRNQNIAQATATGVQPVPGISLPPIIPDRQTHVLQPVPGEQVLQAGSERLPSGLTLPEGWSLMPLRPAAAPYQPSHGPAPAMPVAGQPPAQPLPRSTVPVPIPDHIRAMFTGLPGHTVPNGNATPGQNQASVTVHDQSARQAEQTSAEQTGQSSSGMSASLLNGTSDTSNMANVDSAASEASRQAPAAVAIPTWGVLADSAPENGTNDGRNHNEGRDDGKPESSRSEPATGETSQSKHATVEDTIEDPD